MPLPVENTSAQLVDFLKDRYEIADSVNDKGVFTDDPSEIKVFSFNYINKKGEDKGSVVISLLDDSESSNSLKIYFGQDLGDADSETRTEWYEFLQSIRQFAKMHLLGFDVRNINKSQITKRDVEKDLILTKEDIEPMFESSFGPIDGTVKTSRQPLDKMTIIIKHSARVDPSVKNSRSRRIEKIYLANEKGERFLLPFKSLLAARAMARHIETGGTPYDNIGRDICQLVEEMISLNKFYRKQKKSPSASQSYVSSILDATKERVFDIKKTLASLSTKGGYAKNSPSLTGNAGEIEDDDEVFEDAFDGADLDEESQLAIPHVMKAYHNRHMSEEENEYNNWVKKDEADYEKWDKASDNDGEGLEALAAENDDEAYDDWIDAANGQGEGDEVLTDAEEPNYPESWDWPVCEKCLEAHDPNHCPLDDDELHESQSKKKFKCPECREVLPIELQDETGLCMDCYGLSLEDNIFTPDDFEHSKVRDDEPVHGPDQRTTQYINIPGSNESKENSGKALNEGSLLPTSYAKKQVLNSVPTAKIRKNKTGLYDIGYTHINTDKDNPNDYWYGKPKIFVKLTPRPASTPREAWNYALMYLKIKDNTHAGEALKEDRYEPGEPWTCSACEAHNFVNMKHCRNCGEARKNKKIQRSSSKFDHNDKQLSHAERLALTTSRKVDESIPDREDNDLRNEWTACEEYGHRFDIDGEEYSSCVDCGEPRYSDEPYIPDPIVAREREQLNGIDLNDGYDTPYVEDDPHVLADLERIHGDEPLEESKIAMKVACPDCGAKKGDPCRTKRIINSADKRMTTVHSGRIISAKHVNEGVFSNLFNGKKSAQQEYRILGMMLTDSGFELVKTDEDLSQLWQQGYFKIFVNVVNKNGKHKTVWMMNRSGKSVAHGIGSYSFIEELFVNHPEFRDTYKVLQQKVADRDTNFNKGVNEGLLDFIDPNSDRNIHKFALRIFDINQFLYQMDFKIIQRDIEASKTLWRKGYFNILIAPIQTTFGYDAGWVIQRNGKIKAKGTGEKNLIHELVRNNEEFRDAYEYFTNKYPTAKVTEDTGIIADLLKEYQSSFVSEADVPASNSYGSPLSFVQKALGSKFHTNKEIEDHATTNGKISPFTLLSSPEKDVDDDNKEIIRLADLAKAPRPNPENSGGRGNKPGN